MQLSSEQPLHDKFGVLKRFLVEKIRQTRRNSPDGHVREEYRNHHFQITIAGTDWIFPHLLKSTTAQAALYIKHPGSDHFDPILTTETLQIRSPKFVARANFNPLSMQNSQRYANNSIIRLCVIVNGQQYTSLHFPLAQLLWDQQLDATFTPFVSKISTAKYNGSLAIARLNIIRGREIGQLFDTHKLSFHVCLAPSIALRIHESNVCLAFSSVAERGRWSRLFTSESVRIPFKFSMLQFPRVTLTRGDMVSFSNRNPIRLWLYSSSCGAEKPLGYCQFSLEDLAAREHLTWNSKYLNAHALLSEWSTCATKSSVCITLHTVAEARKKLSSRMTALSEHGELERETSVQPSELYEKSCNSFLSSLSTNTQSEPGAIEQPDDSGKSNAEQVCFPDDWIAN